MPQLTSHKVFASLRRACTSSSASKFLSPGQVRENRSDTHAQKNSMCTSNSQTLSRSSLMTGTEPQKEIRKRMRHAYIFTSETRKGSDKRNQNRIGKTTAITSPLKSHGPYLTNPCARFLCYLVFGLLLPLPCNPNITNRRDNQLFVRTSANEKPKARQQSMNTRSADLQEISSSVLPDVLLTRLNDANAIDR